MKKSIVTVWFLLAASMDVNGETPVPAAPATSQVVTEGIVSAPSQEIWRVFSTAEGFKALGVAQAQMDFRPGGLILSSYDPKAKLGDDKTIQTEIIAYDPGRLLVTRIHQPPKGFPFMEAYKHVWTVISITDLGDARTHLRIAMNGYGVDEESQKMRNFFSTGNDWVLKTLQSKYASSEAPRTAMAHAESPLAVIDIVRLIPAPAKDVWKAISTAEGWRTFFSSDANIGTLPGDAFEPFRGTEGCKLLTVVPEELLSFTSSAPANYGYAKTHPTWVAVAFEGVSPKVTRVRLRHFGFVEQAAIHPDHAADFEHAHEYFTGAWQKALERLASHFEAGAK